MKDDLFLTNLLSGAESRKYSFSLIFLVKSIISAAMSVVFGLGLGLMIILYIKVLLVLHCVVNLKSL